GLEVVIEKHQVRDAFGDVSAATDGDPDRGSLDRGRVVDAVAEHGHHFAGALEHLDDPVFVFRCHTAKMRTRASASANSESVMVRRFSPVSTSVPSFSQPKLLAIET